MDAGILKTLGQIAGIGGIALGVFFLLFRDMIRKSIFPKLEKGDAYRLLRLISILIWSVAVLGIGAWVGPSMRTAGPGSPIVTGVTGNVIIDSTKSVPKQ
jgi:hypothetical protein